MKQICLLCSDSDNASLQKATDSTHVWIFQFLLLATYSLWASFWTLLHGLELLADILGDVHDFVFDVFQVQFFLDWATFCLLVSDASLATLFSSFNRLTCWGGQGLLCPLFWSTNYCQHFRSRYLRGPWELQFELHHELLARTLALLLRSLLVESFDSFAFASLHVALPTDRLLWSFSHFSQMVYFSWSVNQVAHRQGGVFSVHI